MITVFQAVTEYQKDNQISLTDVALKEIGNHVSNHFKRVWCQTLPEGYILPDTGFKKELQPFGVFVTNAYPDGYKSEMIKIIYKYFEDQKMAAKKDPAKVQEGVKPERRERKVIKPKPVLEKSLRGYLSSGNSKPQSE